MNDDTRRYKFGVLDKNGKEVPFAYGNVWAVEKTSGPNRRVVAPSSDYIMLIRELAEGMDEPFWLLYVLLVSRLGNTPGRYQSPHPLSSAELHTFLEKFGDFLEHDGRHHMWIASADGAGQVVYDNHNVLYAYGPLKVFEDRVQAQGLHRGEAVRFPVPHVHCYNMVFDQDEARLLALWPWTISPLRSQDQP